MNEEQNIDLNNRFIAVRKVWFEWMDAGLGTLNSFVVDFQFFCIELELLDQMKEAFEAQNYSFHYTEVRSELDEIGYEVIVGVRKNWILKDLLQHYQLFYEFAHENEFDFEGCGAVFKQI
ncbi:MAG: hypothetical protein KC646_00485 [Candidatus Cloacimonetes bacterium]|nr:hypothetical protein [Candidatus Cloacimonadota bacterium]